MPDTSLLTVLHLSDFHFASKKRREQQIVVDALVSDLTKICIGHRRPDVVIFSGDLTYAAGLDRHDEAYDFLLDRVSKATGCSDERIFITPGNHDLSWRGLEQFEKETNYWRSTIGKPDELSKMNELYESAAFDPAVAAKFANYVELEDFLSAGNRSKTRRLKTSFATVDHIEAINLDVLIFNTAVLSAGGHKSFARDEQLLSIPEYAIMEAVKALSEGSLRIIVTHHPFSMLSEQSSRYLEGEISKHATIHLFGHMHDPQPRRVTNLKGETVSNQAGAVFVSRRDYYSGYSLITIDRQNGLSEVMLRSYFKERNEYDDGVDVIEGGRWWPSQEARQHFRKIAQPIDEASLRVHLKGPALDRLREREADAGQEGYAHEKFVPPPMRRTFIQETTGDIGKVELETPISFTEIVRADANLIIYARAEYGRTTLLKELRHSSMHLVDEVHLPRLPSMIEFRDIGSNADNILRKLRGSAELTPDTNDFESLLKLGHACVLIDDVNFSDKVRMRILRQFVERFPKARYILSSPQWSATKFGACVDPEMPVRFEFVEVREFQRSQMRQLLAREERCTDVEAWLDRLQNEFKEINLPFTAANGTILIEILSEKYNFTPINRAVLMEQFVDSTLRKASIEQSRRETFDYTNKTDLLSHLAAWMARTNDYVPSREAARSELKHYIDAQGLIANLDELIVEFMSARILVQKTDNRIAFRYRSVLEYFIALRMTSDVSFRDWVLDESRYLSFVNEIQYYAGKLRNDLSLVEVVGVRHAAILGDALADIGEVDLEQLGAIHLPLDDGAADLDASVYELAKPPLSQDEKDAELEAEFPSDAEDRQEVFRPRAKAPSDRVLLSLILYSGLAKNMELIPDVEKRKHLSAIWQSWSVLLVAALRFAPRLAKERRVRINGALYEVQAPQGMSDASLLRKLMLLLPHVHIRLLSSALGTEKLERQLTEPMLDQAKEPLIFELFRTGLIADLQLAATPSAIQALAAKLRNHPYLLWSLIVHLGELRRLNRIDEEHFRSLEEPIAGAIANLKGGSQSVRADEKRKQLSRLARDRMTLSMRRERDA